MDTKQDWKGLDGAIAWHFIERQAENWNQVGEMMNEWLKSNTPTKEWVGLADEDMEFLFPHGKSAWLTETLKVFEAKLKQKNNIGVND